MQDILEQIVITLRATWSYRWYAMLVAWIFALAGWVGVISLPSNYTAHARVYVDTDSLLKPLMQGLAIQTNLDQRVILMTKTLLSRPNLEKVSRQLDVDIDALTPRQYDRLISDLSDSIQLDGMRNRKENLYTITYSNTSPDVAKRVVQSLLDILIENTLGDTRKDSDSAQKFLEQQINEYEAKLTTAENRLTTFKRENIEVLMGGDFFSQLQAAQEGLKTSKLELHEANVRRDELRRQVAQLRKAQQQSMLTAGSQVRTTVDERLQAMRTKLDDLLVKFTEEHPDVQELRRRIDDLEKQRLEELQQIANAASSGDDASSPLYQQLMLTSGEANASVAAIYARVKEYENRVAALQNLINNRPQIETELKRLNRDYDIHKQNYDALVARLESARMSEQVERTGDSVKFKIIDPPTVPPVSSGPNRSLLNSVVLLAAMAVGLVFAFVLTQLFPKIYNSKTLRSITGFPVFATISMERNPVMQAKQRLDAMGLSFAGLMLIMTYGGFMLFSKTGAVENLTVLVRELL